MKKNKIIAMCLFPPILTAVSINGFSCSIDISSFNVDGTNWSGYVSGCFNKNDYVIDDENSEITYVNGSNFASLNLVVPDTIEYNQKNYKVKFGKNCFSNNQNIVGSVELNKYSQIIPEGCFEECNSITEIIFNVPPIEFQDFCFHGCLGLEHLWIRENGVLYDNWTTNVAFLGESCFDGCTLSGNLIFSNKLQHLGDWAFANCSHIENVSLSLCDNLNEIPIGVFAWCTWLKSIILPPNSHNIKDYAFMWCTSLQKVCFTSRVGSVVDLGSSVFFHCNKLRSFVNPCVFRKIGLKAFAETETFDYAPWNLPIEYVQPTTIGFQSFEGIKVTKLVFDPNKIADVGSFAFANNTELHALDFSKYTSGRFPNWSGTLIFDHSPTHGIIFLPPDVSSNNLNDWETFFIDNGLKIGRDFWEFTQ